MAKVYGERWQLVDRPELGRGGQGMVFRVKDQSGAHQGEFALKRVPDVNRRKRLPQRDRGDQAVDQSRKSSGASQCHFTDRSLGP